ncbi:MAG: hypothetical protein Q7S73_00535 [bacterium]|nr:hypothetical protein [bacterium]
MAPLPNFWQIINISLLMIYSYLYARDTYQDFRVGRKMRIVILLWLFMWTVSLSATFKSFNIPQNTPIRTYFYIGLLILFLGSWRRANSKPRNAWLINCSKDNYLKFKGGQKTVLGIYAKIGYPLEIGDIIKITYSTQEQGDKAELSTLAEWVYNFNSAEDAKEFARFKDYKLTKEEIEDATSNFVDLASKNAAENRFYVVRLRRV